MDPGRESQGGGFEHPRFPIAGRQRGRGTGPPAWNSLGLGATALWAHALVYNTKRSGEFKMGNQRVLLRRVRFPEDPTPEWFAADLLESTKAAGLSKEEFRPRLVEALRSRRLDPGYPGHQLAQMPGGLRPFVLLEVGDARVITPAVTGPQAV
jgi:hypothetical protein